MPKASFTLASHGVSSIMKRNTLIYSGFIVRSTPHHEVRLTAELSLEDADHLASCRHDLDLLFGTVPAVGPAFEGGGS